MILLRPALIICYAIIVAVMSGCGPDTSADDADSTRSPRAAGKKVFARRNCGACHEVSKPRALVGPSLVGIADRMTEADLRTWVLEPRSIKPDTTMPAWPDDAPVSELDDLVAFLASLHAPERPATDSVSTAAGTVDLGDPTVILQGSRAFQRSCAACHVTEGEAPSHATSLVGVGRRLDAEKIRMWIHDPRMVDPDATMPAYRGSDENLEALTAYLLTLR